MRSVRGVFGYTLAERLRATGLFALAIVAVSAMYVGVFPSMQEQMIGYGEALPEGLAAFLGRDFASPAGYLHSTVFTVLGPILFVAAAVTFGAGAIAGEEEARTLPVLLSAPVSRAGVALRKLAGIALLLTALAGVLLVTLLLLVTALEIEIGAGRLLAATLHLHALTMFAAALAFAVGAASGRKGRAVGAATGVVVLGYVLDGIGALGAGSDLLRWVSPFYWYGGTEPVRTGVAPGWLALLYGCAVAAAALGIRSFDRRDLR